ncbi:hypothetical protein [Streptomyces fulvorobeus]|uniref:Uncharacterized protein n=1 Tax=Streptomyces fulvorobeus TaxID=284028 RepID=A0A7J0CFU6_9ACTN|nr:hypothetical protein [Streptomyces fulvorobeus]NYE44816.1 hypothetical protein [Streptomyces fulvorobeus]GFN01383.1 hypothetical protein Sfulv_61930 [Streptomyces fulvorobeus]
MSATNSTGNPAHRAGAADAAAHRPRRLSTETKSALKTTEFFVYLASVAAVLIASAMVGSEDGHADYFRADKAWLYVVILTVGYMISRGLAKSGSRDPYDDSSH